jgi:hypothetical protein
MRPPKTGQHSTAFCRRDNLFPKEKVFFIGRKCFSPVSKICFGYSFETEELTEAGSHPLDRFATRTSNPKAQEVACSLLTSNGPLVTPTILFKAAAAISRKGNATS